MTHIHRYKLPIKHRHSNALRHIAWAIAILLAVYGPLVEHYVGSGRLSNIHAARSPCDSRKRAT